MEGMSMEGSNRARHRLQRISALVAVLVSGMMLTGCGAGEQDDPSLEEPVTATEQAGEEEGSPDEQASDGGTAEGGGWAADGDQTADAEQQPSDGGGARWKESVAAEATAWCDVPAFDLTVLRSDDSISCDEVQDIFADVDTWGYVDGDSKGDLEEWGCAIASGQVPTPSRFTEVPMCGLDGSHLTALPRGSVPLDGYAVDMSEHAVTGMNGTEYGFTVPESDLICSIVPADGEARGHAGCHGTFEEGIEAEAPDGMAPANTIEIDETGAGFSAHGDPAYWPLGPDGGFSDDVRELPAGSVISAYGVVCQSLAGGAVSCTAGEDAAMTVSASAHDFRP